jgi:transcriptional regulatory protein LEU3
MAIELGLNQPPPPDLDERQKLNRMRTWLNCFCADVSHSIQFGKIPIISATDDYLALREPQTWWHRSAMNLPYDVHLCAYVELIIIMATWRRNTRDFPDHGIENSPSVSLSFPLPDLMA